MMKSSLIVAVMLGLASAASAAEPVTVGRGRAVAVELDRPARQVVVGDPAVADVTVQNSRLIYVFGKVAGATSLAVLDDRGRAILEVPVVVAPGGAADSVTVLHGAGKEVEPGGRAVVFACSGTCVRVPSAAAGTGAAPAK